MILDEKDIEKIVWLVVDNFLIPKFNELGMNASGEWLGALSVKVNGSRGEIWGRDYTHYLKHGRAGGSLPPISAIEKWVGDKFGMYGKEARQRAWAVAKKIEKEGTSYYPEGTDLIDVLYSSECQNYIAEQSKIIYNQKLEQILLTMLKRIK